MSTLQDTPGVVALEAEAERMDYSADGQLLAVATRGGSVSVFLSKLPMLASAYNNRVVLLSSLTQITVYELPFNKVCSQNLDIIYLLYVKLSDWYVLIPMKTILISPLLSGRRKRPVYPPRILKLVGLSRKRLLFPSLLQL